MLHYENTIYFCVLGELLWSYGEWNELGLTEEQFSWFELGLMSESRPHKYLHS